MAFACWAYSSRFSSLSKNSQALLICMKFLVASSDLFLSGWYLRASILQFFFTYWKSISGELSSKSQGSLQSWSFQSLSFKVYISYKYYCYSHSIICYMALNQWYSGVVSYFWPSSIPPSEEEPQSSEMPHLSRLKRLRSLLQESNYKEIHREQLCLFYSRIIKEYPDARATFQYPNFLYEPEIYTLKIFFVVPLIIKTEQIKGVLELYAMFPDDLESQMPLFFIKNPHYNKFKPNKKCVSFGRLQEEKPFSAVMGGLRVSLPPVSKERWEWSNSGYYREDNILNMVRYIHRQLLLDCFPFRARKKQKADSLLKQAAALRNFLRDALVADPAGSPLLTNIQDLYILSVSIDLQINHLYAESQELKRSAAELQIASIKEFLPVVVDKRSEHLMDAAASLQALRDSINLLENKFCSGNITLEEFKRMSLPLFSQQFEEQVQLSLYQPPELL